VLTDLLQVWSFSPPSEGFESRAGTPGSLPEEQSPAEEQDAMVEDHRRKIMEEERRSTTEDETTVCDVRMQD
jgi:hypothetical protein